VLIEESPRSLYRKILIPIAHRPHAGRTMLPHQPVEEAQDPEIVPRSRFAFFERAMELQKTPHRSRLVNHLGSKVDSGQALLGELLQSSLQSRELDEHASKTASPLAVRVNFAGWNQDERSRRCDVGGAHAIHLTAALYNRGQVQFIVPMPRILRRNRRSAMQFDAIKFRRPPSLNQMPISVRVE
jgi:hypothetical protein